MIDKRKMTRVELRLTETSRLLILLSVDFHGNNLLGGSSKLALLLELRSQLGLGQLGNRQLEQILLLGDLLLGHGDAQLALSGQAQSVESLLSDLSDSASHNHSLNRLDVQLAVVSLRDVSLLLEVKGLVDNHLLALCGAVRLRPGGLARIVLRLEMSVTLRSAESEDL